MLVKDAGKAVIECDVVVIGVGGMGSAAVYHLARRGYDVVGIEQYNIPHVRGSSHGITRIFRLPQYENTNYVPIARRALELWKDLGVDHPRKLLHQVGSVDVGPDDDDDSVYTNSKRACTTHNIDHGDLTGAELNKRFPGYNLPEKYRAVFQPDGGFLDCEQCTVAHVESAHAHGATVRARETVQDWDHNEDSITIRTNRQAYTANQLVITAGAWTGQLLPSLADILEPERQVLGWFQPTHPAQFEPERCPVFVADVEEGHFYGVPSYEVPGFKVGKFNHLGETGIPEDLANEPSREDEQILREFVEQYFPKAGGPTMRLSSCMFTNTPDEDFLLDTHPDYENVVVGAGFSGHGFKFASVIGEILADLAVDGQTTHGIEPFRAARFD